MRHHKASHLKPPFDKLHVVFMIRFVLIILFKMCSRSSENDNLKPKEKINLLGALCRKCSVIKASVVLQSKFPYCRDCFIAYFSHKFNATLGKSKIMKHGDKILLAFSGSASSLSLLELVKNSMDETRRKKISTSALLLYIEETPLFNKSKEDRQEILNNIQISLSTFGFEIFYTSYDNFFNEDITLYKDHSLLLNEVNDRISNLISDCKTQTSKIDLINKVRNDILIKAARKLECNKVFLADTSDHLAVKIITNISLGRGGQLGVDVGFCDNRYEDVLFIRPLLECSKKEISYFNTFNNLNPVIISSFGTKDDKFSSIQKLTEAFITELQSSFPSTVHTVVATGNKLITDAKNTAICCLCQAHIEKESTELSAQDAITVSKFVSQLGPNGFESNTLEPKQNCNAGSMCCSKAFSEEELSKSLCYGCSLILKDFKNITNWPSFIKSKAEESIKFKKMEEEIKEFLIDD